MLEEGLAFLNHGSFGATLRTVLADQSRWRDRMERQPMRFFLTELDPALDAARRRLAPFLGARPHDIAFVENATSGANAVLRSFPLARGRRVVFSDHVYPAVRHAIEHVCSQSGAEPACVTLPFPTADLGSWADRLVNALDERVGLLVVDHISSATGVILPIEPVIAAARARGIPVLVDGAHGPGMVDLDLPRLGATWYTGNGHKWLCAAKGTAFLWANPDEPAARVGLHPAVLSLRYGEPFPREFDWIGTRDASAWLSVAPALGFQSELGADRIRAHNRGLIRRATAILCEAWGCDPPVPSEGLGALATLPCPVDLPPTATSVVRIARWLRAQGIEPMPCLHGGRLWIRVSAHLYNEVAEYERLAAVLRPGVEVPAGDGA